jgi:hypothetical protein
MHQSVVIRITVIISGGAKTLAASALLTITTSAELFCYAQSFELLISSQVA